MKHELHLAQGPPGAGVTPHSRLLEYLKQEHLLFDDLKDEIDEHLKARNYLHYSR